MTAAAAIAPTVIKSTITTMAKPTTAQKKGGPPSPLLNDQAQDIPIFLRKNDIMDHQPSRLAIQQYLDLRNETYHMVDTCDPTVACWSEDGETFVVKDPVKFEKQIIPQFFKHSKFSSFVRQLNFYAFRKIKYADTIRIDPKLEAETANYWRFRHEKFQRGKPELLGEIKRMNGQKQQPKPITVSSSSAPAVEKENSALKFEVSSLKQRIDAMTKNIDDLTSMVQKVTLVATGNNAPSNEEDTINTNNKRTKVEESPVPDMAMSAVTPIPARQVALATPEVSPRESTSVPMDMDDMPLPPSMPSPMAAVDRTSTSSSELSDEGFVDQLFTAFKTEDFDFDDAEVAPSSLDDTSSSLIEDSDGPRPQMMNRLSDALSALPRDIQELIVDRLIQAITCPKEIQENLSAANVLKQVEKNEATPRTIPEAPIVAPTKDPKQIANLQLAAATLAALLSQCGGETNLKDSHSKALLIPVHA